MINGKPERLTKKHAAFLEASALQIKEWIDMGCYVASYELGAVGDEVVAPPTTDATLALVILPSFHVIAVVEGNGETSDGDETSACGMTFTIVR